MHKKARCNAGYLDYLGFSRTVVWCRWPESNRHSLRYTPLKRACLPISPHRLYLNYFGISEGADFSSTGAAESEPPGTSTGATGTGVSAEAPAGEVSVIAAGIIDV